MATATRMASQRTSRPIWSAPTSSAISSVAVCATRASAPCWFPAEAARAGADQVADEARGHEAGRDDDESRGHARHVLDDAGHPLGEQVEADDLRGGGGKQQDDGPEHHAAEHARRDALGAAVGFGRPLRRAMDFCTESSSRCTAERAIRAMTQPAISSSRATIRPGRRAAASLPRVWRLVFSDSRRLAASTDTLVGEKRVPVRGGSYPRRNGPVTRARAGNP